MSAYPIAPAVLTTGAQYTGFQTRPRAAAGTFNVADAAHPSSGDCSQCHSGTELLHGPGQAGQPHPRPPPTAQCAACHTSGDFSAMPTLASIHANAPEHDEQLRAVPRRGGGELRDPGGGLQHRRPAGQPHPDQRVVRDLPRRRGLEHRRDAGRQRRQVQRLEDEPRGHHQQLRGLSRAGGHRLVLRRHRQHRRDAADLAGRSDVAHPVVHDLRDLPPRRRCRAGPIAASATTRPRRAPRSRTPRRRRRRSTPASPAGARAATRQHRVWMGMSNYPIAPSVLTAGAEYYRLPDAATRGRRHLQRRRRGASVERRLLAVPQRHQLLHRAGQAGEPHSDVGDGAVLGVPHEQRLLGAADAGQHPRQRAEHDGQLRAVPRRGGARASRFRRPASASSACRATTCRPAASCETCHVGAGLEHRGDAGRQRREVQRLEDEPRGHHQQLRGLPRPGDQRLDASSA